MCLPTPRPEPFTAADRAQRGQNWRRWRWGPWLGGCDALVALAVSTVEWEVDDVTA